MPIAGSMLAPRLAVRRQPIGDHMERKRRGFRAFSAPKLTVSKSAMSRGRRNNQPANHNWKSRNSRPKEPFERSPVG